ncbi:uncharacterized protein LOC104880982 [Vitis vinifera]|uniref:uncharacterized protein LOC104880982 n=1 Tax=Vitis vinifera TaxID=29760 RepID=UPI0028832FCF|nr:uncharacterized protein LOC104880982 [Vitis vinifera]
MEIEYFCNETKENKKKGDERLITPAAGVDPEAFEVIQECLREVFHIDQSSSAGGVPKGVFISLFSSMEGARHGNDTRAQPCSQQAAPAPSTENSSSGGDSLSTGLPVKELLHQFLLALTKARFFKPRPTEDANTRATKVKKYFHDAVEELKNASRALTINNLAETIISQGIMAMELEQYTKAVDLCSCAIALSEDNKDVLYCNRAAAHYGNQKYAAALCDCMKAIEINPKCIEAYSHFGHIRLEQGNIIDALCHGFVKVVQLDPSNEEAQENIRICEEKLRDKFTRMREQNEALVNLIKEPFLPLVRSTRPVAPREAPSTSARPSQSGDRNTNKSPTHETIETGEVENMEEVVALLSISSSNLDDPLGSKP